MSPRSELDLLIPIINRRIGARRDGDDERVLLRAQSKFGERQIDADSRMEQEGGTDEKEQQQQKDKIHQGDKEDQKRIEMYRSAEFHRCLPAALELGSNSIMDDSGWLSESILTTSIPARSISCSIAFRRAERWQ